MRPVHLVAILVLFALILPAAPAHAAGVVSVCDEAHLRTALTGGGTVTFSCSGYITLANTITISANTIINGSGQSVTISGSDAVRVFNVKSGVTLSLVGLTIREGNDTSSLGGGAVLADGGNVSIDNCLFADTNALFGGCVMIYNGALTVVGSTFSGCSASIGGAITGYDATMTVSHSTFSMNSAVSSAVADGSGGAIYAEGGALTVSNSTIHRNSADGNGGGIAGDSATVTVINSTFFNNSAGVEGNSLERSGSGSMTLKNTILYSNLPGANCGGSITDGGNNLSYSDATCPGTHSNPLLQTLNSNGGPTFTMLLGQGSPAIDAGSDAVCAAAPVNKLDQRGVARPQGAHCDIGAVEQHPYSTANVLKVPNDYATIQGAVDAAAEGDEIWVAAGTYEENLSISKGVALYGGWDSHFKVRTPGDSTIDGQGLSRAISITGTSADTVISIDGFTVEGGNATGLGGGPETLSAVEKSRQGAAEIAGYPRAVPSDLLTPAEHVTRLQTELAGVVAGGLYPGGPAAYRSLLDRVRQQVARLEQAGSPLPRVAESPSQQGTDCGGGIYSWNASLHLLNSTILGNVASLSGDGCGGGIFVGQSPPNGVLIQGNTLRENIASAAPGATGSGGGLHATQTPAIVVENNVVELNSGTSAGLFSFGEGGGLFVESSPEAVVSYNQVLRNAANGGWEAYEGLGGGAMLLGADGARVTHNQFDENLGILHGWGGGGGLAVALSAGVIVADNDVTGNWGCMFQMEGMNVGGGGISLYQTDSITVTGNTIQDNTATVSGGNVGFATGGGLDGQLWNAGRVADNTFRGNVACQTGTGRGGGASLWDANEAVVADNTFAGNVASVAQSYGAGGGVFLLNTQDCRLQGNTFRENQAAASGQGHGGGLCVWEDGPETWDTKVEANLFLDNQADADPAHPSPSDGGACSFDTNGLVFTNNVVAGNSADLGGGLYLSFVGEGVLTNNTLVRNDDTAVLVDLYNTTPITFTNNIVVSHTVGITVAQGMSAVLSYTLWHGNGADTAGDGAVDETHPVTGDPSFVKPEAGDFRLTIASAARDAGDPAGVPPAPAHDIDGVPRPQGGAVDIGAYEWKGHWLHLPVVARSFTPRAGWAIGDSADGAAIVHTSDSGLTWQAQGNTSAWTGLWGNDISAVDDQTAWAALGSGPTSTDGAILHTTDGGAHWVPQAIPAGLIGGIQGVKGLSRTEAWAASLYGTVLHTTDGGATWNVVPHPTTAINDVNRIDALGGADVWIASPNLEHGGNSNMIHTQDNGLTWRQEPLPNVPADHGPMTVNAVSPLVAWTALDRSGNVYRTLDGGANWLLVTTIAAGTNDADDLCAAGPEAAWVVLTPGTGAGMLWRVHVAADGSVYQREFQPASTAFTYEGITCLDEHTVWAVGGNPLHVSGLPLGVIVSTSDGGEHWVQGSAPADIEYWKVSFAGARR